MALSSDNSCSVLWLVPEAESELEAAMAVVTKFSAMAAWGFVAAWEDSKLLESRAQEISRASRASAEFSVGDTRIKGSALALPLLEDRWFGVCLAGK